MMYLLQDVTVYQEVFSEIRTCPSEGQISLSPSAGGVKQTAFGISNLAMKPLVLCHGHKPSQAGSAGGWIAQTENISQTPD